jgi:hypothetical protein
MDISSRILVVGSDQVGKHEIIDSLAKLCGENIDKKTLVPTLTLRTKYYKAPIEFHVHKILNNEPLQELQYDLKEYEAMICIVDVNQHESFSHVSKFVEKTLDQHQFEVSLLVGNLVKSNDLKQIQDLQKWSQDFMFEFVQLPHRSFFLKQEETLTDENEKIGMERILEALECNMWRSMEMISKNQVSPTTTAKKEEQTLKDNKQQQDTKAEKSKTIQNNQQEDDQEEDTKEADERLQTLLKALQVTDNQKNEQHEEEEDVDFHEFSNLVSQVRRIRDQGKTLSDEERRRQAAEMSIRLWNFLGVDDEEEEHSSSSDE